MISGISKVEADYTCRDLDHCGYHKKPNSIIVLVYIVLWEIYKNYYKHKSQVNFQLKLNLNSLNDYPKQLVHYCFDMTFGGEYPCFTVFKPRNLCLV